MSRLTVHLTIRSILYGCYIALNNLFLPLKRRMFRMMAYSSHGFFSSSPVEYLIPAEDRILKSSCEAQHCGYKKINTI